MFGLNLFSGRSNHYLFGLNLLSGKPNQNMFGLNLLSGRPNQDMFEIKILKICLFFVHDENYFSGRPVHCMFRIKLLKTSLEAWTDQIINCSTVANIMQGSITKILFGKLIYYMSLKVNYFRYFYAICYQRIVTLCV